MKRIICLITVLCLVLGSFSFCFAVDWSTTDQTNLSNAASRLYYNGYSAAYYLYQISSKLNTLSNTVTDIKNALFDSGYSVAFWVHEVQNWMSPIYNSITQTPIDLQTIIGALGYYDTNNTYHPYLIGIDDLKNALTNIGVSNNATVKQNSHLSFVNNYQGDYIVGRFTNSSGGYQETTYNWNNGSPLGNIALLLKLFNNSFVLNAQSENANNKTQQSFISWTDLTSSSFTPTSSYNGVYQWMSKIQAPTARLAYVLASDERIDAQEAAAANEEAVVDNFIDSSGAGSASTSDIGSISDLSSGYQNNFGSDASVSGIFNIFNSNNMGWFSQETANQLDTTAPTRRGSSFDTPLLDQQINDIYDQIGVKHD